VAGFHGTSIFLSSVPPHVASMHRDNRTAGTAPASAAGRRESCTRRLPASPLVLFAGAGARGAYEGAVECKREALYSG
jgi:hypothetical protein